LRLSTGLNYQRYHIVAAVVKGITELGFILVPYCPIAQRG